MTTYKMLGTAGSMLRAARRVADLSQRDLARAAGLPASTVGRIEAGALSPRVGTLLRLLRACGCDLVAFDLVKFTPLQPWDPDPRDRSGRRFPAHLDVRKVGTITGWWGYRHGRWDAPEFSFDLDRWVRDGRRRGRRLTAERKEATAWADCGGRAGPT